MTPVKWIWNLRAQYAYELLKNVSNIRIIDIAIYGGFKSHAHLSRILKSKFKQTPSEIRQETDEHNMSNYMQNHRFF